jgi:hypothetical protein
VWYYLFTHPTNPIGEKMSKYGNIDGALGKLREYDSNIFTQNIDVSKLDFTDGEQHGMLVTEDGKRLSLTKDSVTSLARFLKLPAGYLRTASSTLVNKSVHEFGEQLKNPIAQAIIHKNPVDNRFVLRGMISEGKKFRENSCMLDNVKKIFGDNVAIEHAPWSVADHPAFFRTRIIWPDTETTIQGDKVMCGMDLLSSDIEHIQDQINLLLYREVCTNGMVAEYGKRPYFYMDNRKSSIFDYEAVVESISNRIGKDAPVFFDNVKNAHSDGMDRRGALDVLSDLENRRKLPKSFVVKTMTAIQEDPTFNTRWDLVNAITAQARKYKHMARLRYEAVGGNILGLSFKEDKKVKEDAIVKPSAKKLAAVN